MPGDLEQISVRAAFPKLSRLEQRWGSLIRGQILGARERRRLKETAKTRQELLVRSRHADANRRAGKAIGAVARRRA